MSSSDLSDTVASPPHTPPASPAAMPSAPVKKRVLSGNTIGQLKPMALFQQDDGADSG